MKIREFFVVGINDMCLFALESSKWNSKLNRPQKFPSFKKNLYKKSYIRD